MTPTTTQIDPSLFLGMVITALCTLLGLAVHVVALLRAGKTQRREVSMMESFATVTQIKELADRIGMAERSVLDLKESIHRNGEERRVRIELKVEEAKTEARNEAKEIRSDLSALMVTMSSIKTTSDDTHNRLQLLMLNSPRVKP